MDGTAPVMVVDLFPEERQRLLELVTSLSEPQWKLPTACASWSVKDILAHVIGDDFGVISGGRNGFRTGWFSGDDWTELVDYLNAKNEAWVTALRRLSPALLIELLAFAGERVQAYYESVDLAGPGPNVAWAGSGPHSMWLHVAREYTERWLHHMQIREATGAAGLYEPRLFHPVLATFVHALPRAYAAVDGPDGTDVRIEISGAAGGVWSLRRAGGAWLLLEGAVPDASATVRLDQDTAWKLWTKGMAAEEAGPRVAIEGDRRLGEPVLRAVSIIA